MWPAVAAELVLPEGPPFFLQLSVTPAVCPNLKQMEANLTTRGGGFYCAAAGSDNKRGTGIIAVISQMKKPPRLDGWELVPALLCTKERRGTTQRPVLYPNSLRKRNRHSPGFLPMPSAVVRLETHPDTAFLVFQM